MYYRQRISTIGDGEKKDLLRLESAGSFTVDAALVFPLVFFLLVLICHVSFMMYARCLAAQDNYLMAFRASILRDGEDMEAYIDGRQRDQIGRKYFGVDLPQMVARADKKKVECETSTEVHRKGFDLATGEKWRIQTRAEAFVINQAAHIRKLDRMTDLMQIGLEEMRRKRDGD